MEEGVEKFVKYLGIFVYMFLTEQYHLSWWQALLIMLLILCGLFLVACICLVAWGKARSSSQALNLSLSCGTRGYGC